MKDFKRIRPGNISKKRMQVASLLVFTAGIIAAILTLDARALAAIRESWAMHAAIPALMSGWLMTVFADSLRKRVPIAITSGLKGQILTHR